MSFATQTCFLDFEVYAASNGVNEFLHITYCADEMGITIPKPFTLYVDNAAAKVFCDDTAYNSRLKHIDCRQWWVRMLRDKSILQAKWIPTKDNLADLFTKIQCTATFNHLRAMTLHPGIDEQHK